MDKIRFFLVMMDVGDLKDGLVRDIVNYTGLAYHSFSDISFGS
jgi:hypothetical protein